MWMTLKRWPAAFALRKRALASIDEPMQITTVDERRMDPARCE